ncbi:hypothetical protein HCJ57_11155 [Listeria booriae]|uniref:polymorphic toxin type 30 domain-containing protein n=1 Tax=Listeria booriae TaxID=1552123 RepID=UPI0016252251|nr:polymorphic toxin type 30 domain-containing protein [Listeria booriae]MBC1573434.1 hypothetical protein [Listeria booriae]MBC2057070.1 hypothetical protein [Listeria booriae]MBC2206756.1 hypothetical protein [Listeria booriae]
MSYLIKYDDITNFSGYAGQKLNTYQEQLTLIQNSLQGIVGLDQLKGSAADSIKNYLNEVHSSLIASIQQLITEYQAHFLLYKDGYYQEIDSDPHTQIDEDVLIDKKSFFNTSNTDFENIYADFVSGIRNIQDILPNSSVNPNGLRQDYTEINRHIDTLKEKTGNYEAQHQKDDLTNFKSMLLSIQQLIKENQAKPQGVTTYQTGDIASFPSAASLTGALQKSNEFLQGNSAAIQAASGRESERWDALKAEEEARLAEEREKQGWLQLVGGVAAVLVGGAAIVLTAGAATPIVVGVGAVAFGSIAYGASEMIEGGQQVYYGMKGDGYTFATNPLRDTLFMGNQAAYDTFGLLTTTASSIVIPGALAARSAIAAGRIVGVADIAITASSRAALGEIGGLLLSRGLPPLLEPYVGGEWATGIGLVSSMVAAAGGGAWAVRGVNSALDVPSTGVFKPRVTGRGVSENVGDFSNLQGSSVDDILSRIPKDANKRLLTPQPGKVTEGFEYTWKSSDGTKMTVRVHGPDPSAPVGSNAANGWVVRVQQGKKYLDPISGDFQPPGISRPNSEFYSEELINSTHIPIQTPKK